MAMVGSVGVRLLALFHAAPFAGNHAGHMFELDGGVVNAESAKGVVDAFKNGVTRGMRHVVDQDMRAQRAGLRTNAPDMQIVDIQDAIHFAHGGRDFAEGEAAGQAFEKNIQGFPGDAPGRDHDERGERDGKQRINGQPVGVMDYQRARENRHCAEGIAEHVDESRAQVEIVLLALAQGKHDAAVESEGEQGNPEHDCVIHRFRAKEPLNGLPDDEAGDGDQCDGVEESRENAGAMVAPGSGLIRGTALKIETDGGEQQSECVREVVPCVGKKGQAMGAQPGIDLDGGEGESCGERQTENPAGRGNVMVVAQSFSLLQFTGARGQRAVGQCSGVSDQIKRRRAAIIFKAVAPGKRRAGFYAQR